MIGLLENLGLDNDSATIERAEDVPPDMGAWEKFCDYIRIHAADVDVWKTIGTVREGIGHVISSDTNDVPQPLERFLEELTIWARDIDDPKAVQLLHHEVETTEWIRRLYPDAQKEFWKIDLPLVNEYRGKYRDVLDSEALGENCIVQRRIQDLAEKLAFKGLSGASEQQDDWYQQIFDDLIEVLRNVKLIQDTGFRPPLDRMEFGGPEEEKILKLLSVIDSKLIPFYLLRLSPEQREYVRVPDEYPKEGEKIPADFHSYDPPARFTQGVVLIGRAELLRPHPSLRPLRPFVPFLKHAHYRALHYPTSLNAVLLHEKFSPPDLAEFWIEVLKKPNYLSLDSSRYSHPVINRLALTLDSAEPSWNELSAMYFEGLTQIAQDGALGGRSVFKGGFREFPMIKRVLAEKLPGTDASHPVNVFFARLDRWLKDKRTYKQQVHFNSDYSQGGPEEA